MKKLLYWVLVITLVALCSCWKPPNECPKSDNPYAGYIVINETYNSNMFYWFFLAADNNDSAPIILWLEGGPGYPGVFGVFAGPGPIRLLPANTSEEDPLMLVNVYSWNTKYHMIFVDSPVGVGFSFSDDPRGFVKTLEDVADDLYIFLEKFFYLFPQYKANDLYIFGESYGGKYVPATAYRLMVAQQAGESNLNLKGIGMGDPLTDPLTQIQTWVPFAQSLGLLNAAEAKVLSYYVAYYVKAINAGNWTEAASFMFTLETVASAKGISMYDTRSTFQTIAEAARFLCYSYVNTTEWRQGLGVYPHYMPGTSPPAQEGSLDGISLDIGQSHLDLLPKLLDNYKVLIYNGMYDWLITPLGVRTMLDSMQWSGSQGWSNATNVNFEVYPYDLNPFNKSVVAGYTQKYGNLQLTVINDAGHFVTFDQPQAVLELVKQFINN